MWQKLYRFFSLCTVATLFPLSLQAGGIMLYEISSYDTSFASAGWSSRCNEASTVFTNPAGMSRLCSTRFEFGGQAIYQHMEFDPNNSTTVPGSIGQASEWFPSGSIFYVQPITNNWTFGIGCLSYCNAELDFNDNWVGRYYLTKTELKTFSAVPAISYRFNNCLSIGVGANIMCGCFEQKSAINNILDGMPDGELEIEDDDIAVGLVAGILYEFSPCTRIGLQYLSPVSLHFSDHPEFENIGPILRTRLSATGLFDTRVHIRSLIPQSLILSGYHELNRCWAVMADIGWQQWSDFAKNSITLGRARQESLTFTPDFKNTWHAAVGAQYFYSPCLSFSGGLAYDSSAVSARNRPFDFVVGRQWRIGTGFSWNYCTGFTLQFAYEFMWSGDLSVHRNFGPLAGNVSGDFDDVSAHFINLNLTWAF